jgi:hypothetical protein
VLDTSEKNPLYEALFHEMMKVTETVELAKKTKEIFDALATIYK